MAGRELVCGLARQLCPVPIQYSLCSSWGQSMGGWEIQVHGSPTTVGVDMEICVQTAVRIVLDGALGQ